MTFQRDLAWQHLDLLDRCSVTHQCARYAVGLNYSMIPEDVVHHAKRCLVDAIGCAIGAYEAPGRPICEETIREIGGPHEATVFCSGLRTSAMNAAFVNGFLARFLDYGDLGGGGHIADHLPSILAVAEREKASGKDFLASLVISGELGARFEESTTPNSLGEIPIHTSLEEKGWTVDIRAGLNQPPAIGKLMGLNEEQIAHAIGICMSHALPMGILDANREENVMAKNIRFGWVGYDAILSCMLAKKGFTGPLRIIESETGIRKILLQGEMDLERLIDFSGWRMREVRFKTLAVNGTTLGHVYATLGIVKEQNLQPQDIAEVRIRVTPREARHTTTPAKKYPRNAESADHSAFYANALAIKERAFGGVAFDPGKFTDPVVLDLIEKITVTADPSLGRVAGAAEIVTKDGRRFRKQVDLPHGFGGDPLTDKELEEKFSAMATKYMPDERIRKIFDTCWNVEKLADLGELTKLTIFPGST